MKIQKMYVKSVRPYQTGLLFRLERWITPEALLKELHHDNPELDINKCYIQVTIKDDENNMPTPKVVLYAQCTEVEFL